MKTIKYKKSKAVDPIMEIPDGCWIDLRVKEDLYLKPNETRTINLGYAFDMPKDIEALMVCRSSTYKNYSISLTNSMAIMDDTYRGDGDYWRAQIKSDKQCIVEKNSRLFQFRLQPKMNAHWWVKVKFLFTRYKFKEVDVLGNRNRGGIGQTGKI